METFYGLHVRSTRGCSKSLHIKLSKLNLQGTWENKFPRKYKKLLFHYLEDIKFLLWNFSYKSSNATNEFTFGDIFMRRCTSLTAKPFWRVCIDGFLLLVVPAIISGFFYMNVIRNLWNQEKRVERNRVLSISFIISWFLWILLWTPKITLGFLQLSAKSVSYSAGNLGSKVSAYLVPSQIALQMLYSQLNPFIFIVLIKKLQDYHKKIWVLVKKVLFFRNPETTEKEVSLIKNQEKEFGKKYFQKSNDANFLIKLFVSTSALLAVFTLIATTASPIVQTVGETAQGVCSSSLNQTQHLRKAISKVNLKVGG